MPTSSAAASGTEVEVAYWDTVSSMLLAFYTRQAALPALHGC